MSYNKNISSKPIYYSARKRFKRRCEIMKEFKKLLQTFCKILKLEIPITATYIIEYAGSFGTNIMIGKINDKRQLAATGLISTTKTLFDTGKSLQTSLNSYIKSAKNDEEKYNIGGIAQQGLFLGIITSLPTMLAAALINPILLCVGQNSEISQNVDSFYKSYLWSIPASLLLNGSKQFAQAAGTPYSAVGLSIVRSGLNLGIGYILIFGLDVGVFKIPEMGLSGMGLAYTIQSWISCIGYLLFLSQSKKMKPYKLLKPRLISTLKHLPTLFFAGLPMAIYTGSQKLCNTVLSLIVGSMQNSEDMLSAYSIQNQYYYILLFPAFCMVSTLSILTTNTRRKNNLSNKDITEIKRIGNTGIIMGISYSLILLGTSLFASELGASLYIDINNPENRQIIRYTKILLPLAMTNTIFVSAYEATTGSLLGLVKVIPPALNAIFGSWLITIPIALLLNNLTTLDVVGIIIAQILGSFVTSCLNTLTWAKVSSSLTMKSIKQKDTQPSCLQKCFKKITFFKKNNNSQNVDLLEQRNNDPITINIQSQHNPKPSNKYKFCNIL